MASDASKVSFSQHLPVLWFRRDALDPEAQGGQEKGNRHIKRAKKAQG